VGLQFAGRVAGADISSVCVLKKKAFERRAIFAEKREKEGESRKHYVVVGLAVA
jgi:hypothetical protein